MSPIASSTPQRNAPIPHGRTARRLEWPLLPPPIRAMVEQRIGSRVVSAESSGAGYTPGLASVLTCADGSRHFVKAASKRAQRPFADAYREETRKLRALPDGLPVPRLLWSHEDELWVVLELEHVAGPNPSRPWRAPELDACLDTLEVLADTLDPPPMRLATFRDDFEECLAGWSHVRRVDPRMPHLQEAAALAAGFRDATAGTTLVHTDARDDNFLLTGGRALLGGWNWPVVGAAWIDTVSLLISAHGDGLDADGILAGRRLTRDVAAEDVDTFLALMAGYFLERRDQPAPNSSPYLRVHQSWYAEATWSWLSARRGWS
ncbi:MAG TPA: phosphotransferase [Nocardioidaceae bacterium]|nr:phosphotransferase [Nocardioidaceae bacterium]